MSDIIYGFEPFFQPNSKLLILGSFPSVKSRRVEFYYGNRQNKFWKMLGNYFQECIGEKVSDKKDFLKEHGIALWDIVMSCEIVGSSDASIKNFKIADVPSVLRAAPIEKILLNGTKAYQIFCSIYGQCSVPYALMPSTSPANVRYDETVWHSVLDSVFQK